jgi:hypothetical protein
VKRRVPHRRRRPSVARPAGRRAAIRHLDGRNVDEVEIDDDFDSRIAFENLRHNLGPVEALAKAANEALEGLPFTNDPERRR